MSSLPTIDFASKSTADIKAAVITSYESISGRTLAPGDPVRLFLETIAALIVQQRALIDFTGKMNLLAYATGDYLEHIGVLVGTTRIAATAATTTLRWTLSAEQQQAVVIPAGTRATPGSNVIFATTKDITILAGSLIGDVEATCSETGTVGNGYTAGQINKIVDPIQWVASVTNTTASEGGAEIEADDAFRARIHQAPESFSVAGPQGAYEYWAKSASSLIVDVAVTSPSAGKVNIYPLLAGGTLPGTEILEAVDAVVNDTSIRPLTDEVTVLAPTTVAFDIALTYYIASSNATLETSIQTAVTAAIAECVLWQKSALGRDVNPSELISRIMAAGAKRVEVTTPVYVAVDASKVAIAGTVTATYGGLENG